LRDKELPSNIRLDVFYVPATLKVPCELLYCHSPTCLLGVQRGQVYLYLYIWFFWMAV